MFLLSVILLAEGGGLTGLDDVVAGGPGVVEHVELGREEVRLPLGAPAVARADSDDKRQR